MVALVSTAVRLSHSGASTRSTSIGATSRRGADGGAGDEGHEARAHGEALVEVLGEGGGGLLGPHLALVRLAHAGVDGAQAGLHLVDATAAEHQRVRDVDRQGIGQALAQAGLERRSERLSSSFEQAGPVGGEHGPDEAGEGREPPGAERQPRRRRDDVFELVRLVEDDHVVLGQEGLAPGEVEPVEVGVDDHQVGGLGPPACHLGEARLAERAAGGAGALLARHAHRLPGPRVHRPRQLGLVAGRRRRGPGGEPGQLTSQDRPGRRARRRARGRPGRRHPWPPAGAAGRRSSSGPSAPPRRRRGRGAR